MRGALLIFCLLVGACDQKQAPSQAPDAVSVLIDRETLELQRLEAAQRADQKRVQEETAGLRVTRLADDLSSEAQILVRARKTLVTARHLSAEEGRARIEKVMAEARAARSDNEAKWVALQAELARGEAMIEGVAPAPEAGR